MKYTSLICILLSFCIMAAASLSCSREHPEDESRYYMLLYYNYLQKGDYDSLANAAVKIFSARDDRHNNYLVYYSGLQCAQASVFLDDYTSAKAYIDTLSSLENWDDYPELMAMFNMVMALYEIKNGFDYPSALIHLEKALDYYKNSGDDINTCVTLNNISVIYFFRRDTTGLRYTREGVNISARHGNNPYMKCMAYVGMAMMLLLQEDYDNAGQYASEAKMLADANGYTVFNSRICMVLAETYLSHGNTAKASELIKKGFSATENMASDYYFELALTYGKMLIAEKRWQKTEDFLNETLQKASDSNIRYRPQILHLLYRLFEEQGDIPKSHTYFMKYVACRDSLVNIDKETELNSLRDLYEKTSYENAIKKKEIEMYRIILVCALSILIGGFFLYSYIHQRKINRNLTSLNQEYQKRNEMLEKYWKPQLNGDARKSSEEDLFRRLEKLMREKHIYRNNDISLDGLASMLGTNRTYISKIINKFADKSFWDYINMYRIAEATEILSDTENDIHVKDIQEHLGYNSAASFFRVFHKETGVTPLNYRKEVRRIRNSSKSEE